MFVKPVTGRTVPDPVRGDLLPETGRNVDESSYWHRRRVAGDVEINPETTTKKAASDDGQL